MIRGEEEELNMKLRIAIWACVGALVVLFWTLWNSATSSTPNGIASTLAHLTCPVSVGGHYPLSFYFVLLVNTVTYALAGTVVEIVRRAYQRRALKHPDLA
jgi:hypothetical protein